MPGTTPRTDVRSAFKTILMNANLGVTIYDRMPYEGAEPRSVVLAIVSGSAGPSALASRILPSMRAREARFRLQVDCYHDDKAECEKLADRVEQAITDKLDTLRSSYEIYDVRKVVDMDTLPAGIGDQFTRQSRVLMDFEFFTHRATA